ncbi:uncharacterized protein LOC116610157 [Nematostella vectensis]|uniref:uncharacterized protein LOC116610157 n=1 Tax=Nematostella vectensis TaxID=45351 RepID=UPI0013901479|nr:uncharacterized protein LOC116610157 [Nematostella vectensis]
MTAKLCLPLCIYVFCILHCVSTSSLRVKADNNPSDDDALSRFFRRDCHVGLWCGKKREPAIEQSSRFKSADDCPVGLWCGKKRSASKGESIEISHSNKQREQGEEESTVLQKLTDGNTGPPDEVARRMFRRASTSCPPGLWCGKKRSIPEQNPSGLELQLPYLAGTLPSYEVNDEDAPQSDLKKMFRRASTSCPPGLWCGRKRTVYSNIGIPPRQSSLKSKFERSCPPGLWCGK